MLFLKRQGRRQAALRAVKPRNLVSGYGCGVLETIGDLDSGATDIWSMRAGWVEKFLSKYPRYNVKAESGPPAPTNSTHPTTYASELGLLDDEKRALVETLRRHLYLREGWIRIDEYWRTVYKCFKKQRGYDLWWLRGHNEAEYEIACCGEPWCRYDWEE
ncbi:hypothetical protein EJ03DRAFT_333674 [Teratosphaeria nubilosa]|uniref:Uncharacterized protein n=1 Tax=Teratosphaeria nubilosa TaxID=161662 RepID=A0A6G1LJK1_9PEZI|nr:hypothetical protein EJ03DRAFT_333674 [Teratosphaeria nubilosa]